MCCFSMINFYFTYSRCLNTIVFYSPSTSTQESSCMAFINKDQCSILLSKITDTHQRSNVTIHREHAVCYHQPQTAGLCVKNRVFIIRDARNIVNVLGLVNNYNCLKKINNCSLQFCSVNSKRNPNKFYLYYFQ